MTAGKPLRYVPYDELAGRPNVIGDGSATEGTVLTLSHWPNTPCPPGLERDLSAEMAMAYLARGDLHGRAEVVSNNHFDQDGLVSLYALVDPEAAMSRRDLLLDVAAAGDFATYGSRTAARISMVIAAFATAARTPLGPVPDDYGRWTATLYQELLGRLPDLCDHPDRYREWWAEEDASLAASQTALARGEVRIDEVAALDLAVVHVPTSGSDSGGHRFGGQWVRGLHPMAIHNATGRLALLVLRGRRYEFCYRYESWVQYRSRRPRPRVDLQPLADRLSTEEPTGARWVFEGVGALTPRLVLRGTADSVIAPDTFRSRLEAFLATAPPAWDPYRPAEPV